MPTCGPEVFSQARSGSADIAFMHSGANEEMVITRLGMQFAQASTLFLKA
jgi:hypothetical protein